MKVLDAKIKHLAPQGRTKTLQKRIRNVTLIFHGFYIDFGSHVRDILKVLAASSSQYRLVSCFQMVRFNGQYLKVSAVALQLQSADTGRCHGVLDKIRRNLAAPLPPGVHLEDRTAEENRFFSASNFGIIFGMPFFRPFSVLGPNRKYSKSTFFAPLGSFFRFLT